MLEDRPYMRQDSFDMRRSATLVLMVALIAVFVLQTTLYFYTNLGRHFPVDEYLALSLQGLRRGFVWQLLSFQFLHAGLLHLFFNVLTLYFFGRSVEETLGTKAFLKLYFLSGFLGGVLQVLANLVLPQHHNITVVGASAGILGVLTAYALLFPERSILLWFVIPVKAKYLLWFTLFLSAYGTIVPFDNYAHTAHLGGILGGFAYLRWGPLAEKLFVRRRVRNRSRELIKVHLPKGAPWQRSRGEPEELPPGEFISREVDPILDKISAHGIQSLTPRERKILEAARARMERR